MILAVRTDKPEAELYIVQAGKQKAKTVWHAHRQLAETIHTKIDELLKEQNLSLTDLTGVVVFEGPGSFTGLRIGMSVANALAYSLHIPVVARGGDDWLKAGSEELLSTKKVMTWATPHYGAQANITKPRK